MLDKPEYSKKIQFRWAMYDWACSAYNLVITSTIFPSYFIAITSIDDKPTQINFLGLNFLSTAWYNFIQLAGFIIVALFLPLMSSLADVAGNKRRFLRVYIYLGSLSCMLLYFFDSAHIAFGFIFSMLALVCFWLGNVFYNAYLVDVAPPNERNKVSAKGFSLGYIGSVILQLFSFLVIMKHDWFGITSGEGCKLSFVMVGIWWFVFGEYAIHNLPVENNQLALFKNLKRPLKLGFAKIVSVFQQIKSEPIFYLFLISFFLYSIGIQTVMLAATIFGKSELQIEANFLIVTILVIQLVAIPGAYTIVWVANKIGNIKTLILCAFVWFGIGIAAYYIPPKAPLLFVTIGFFVGFVMGGTQSLSRSTFARFIPAEKNVTTFFSFYDFAEKIAIIIGLFLFGLLTNITGNMRTAILFVAIVFLASIIFLFKTNKIKV